MNRIQKARRKSSHPRPANAVLAKRKRTRKKAERVARVAARRLLANPFGIVPKRAPRRSGVRP